MTWFKWSFICTLTAWQPPCHFKGPPRINLSIGALRLSIREYPTGYSHSIGRNLTLSRTTYETALEELTFERVKESVFAPIEAALMRDTVPCSKMQPWNLLRAVRT